MRRLVLVVASVLLSLELSAQVGVITIEANAVNVPLGHWYVSKDKALENHAFYYIDEKTAAYMLSNILEEEGQSYNMPEGVDEDGDNYWVVVWESGFESTIYLTTVDGFSLITVFTQ
jgi:hypothetical protein